MSIRRFFREGLVNYINALVTEAKRIRPGIKVAIHLYPAFLPDPLYGKDLKADYVQETVAWYFAWPEEKIADYTRKILSSRHYPGSVSVPFVGLNADSHSPLPMKTPERLEAELRLILANGGNSLAICNGDDMLKPGYREIFMKYPAVSSVVSNTETASSQRKSERHSACSLPRLELSSMPALYSPITSTGTKILSNEDTAFDARSHPSKRSIK